jgi:hypothetical protein
MQTVKVPPPLVDGTISCYYLPVFVHRIGSPLNHSICSFRANALHERVESSLFAFESLFRTYELMSAMSMKGRYSYQLSNTTACSHRNGICASGCYQTLLIMPLVDSKSNCSWSCRHRLMAGRRSTINESWVRSTFLEDRCVTVSA